MRVCGVGEEDAPDLGITLPGHVSPFAGSSASASLVARPRASPGIAAGARCRGEVSFAYKRVTSGEHASAFLVMVGDPVIDERLEPVPPGIPLASRVTYLPHGDLSRLTTGALDDGQPEPGLKSGALLIPLALPREGGPTKAFTGRFTEGWEADYQLEVTQAAGVALAVRCNRGDRASVSRLEVSTGAGPGATVTFGREATLAGHLEGAEVKGPRVQLTRPGLYRLRPQGGEGCWGYSLELSRLEPGAAPRADSSRRKRAHITEASRT
jgi:hypothetical protein